MKRGYKMECYRWLADLLHMDDGGEATIYRARALIAAGFCLMNMGNLERSYELQCQGLEIARHHADGFTIARAMRMLGLTLRKKGEMSAAVPLCAESLHFYREQHNTVGIAYVLNDLASLYCDLGNLEQCLPLYEESITLSRRHGHTTTLAAALSSFATLQYQNGDYAAARRAQEEALALRRANGDWRGAAYALMGLAPTLHKLCLQEECLLALKEARRLFQRQGDRYGIGIALLYLGDQLAGERAVEAKRSLLASLTIWRELDLRHHEYVLLCLEVLARVEAKLYAWPRAACLYSAACTLRATTGFRYFAANRKAHEEERSHVRAHLSEADWNRYRADGEAMSWQQAIIYALSQD
jgi:hypothetical protein